MATDSNDPTRTVQDELAVWHSTHPDATFAQMEAAVEEQFDRIRVQPFQERIAGTWVDEHPLCQECGAPMKPETTGKRILLLRGDQPLELERSYVVCPRCGAGFFPSVAADGPRPGRVSRRSGEPRCVGSARPDVSAAAQSERNSSGRQRQKQSPQHRSRRESRPVVDGRPTEHHPWKQNPLLVKAHTRRRKLLGASAEDDDGLQGVLGGGDSLDDDPAGRRVMEDAEDDGGATLGKIIPLLSL
jgi:hypothetical protein